MKKVSTFAVLMVAESLLGCSSGPLSVHAIDVQQGNALEPESIGQLNIGMSPEQVRYLLGHPVMVDPFQPNRWDYLYYYKPGNGQAESRRLTVYFNDGKVERIDQPGSTHYAGKSDNGA